MKNKIFLLCIGSMLAVSQGWSQDIIGFGHYLVTKDRPMELMATLFDVSILPGQSQDELAPRLPVDWHDNEAEQQIILESTGAQVIFKYSEKGIYQTSIESSPLGITKEFTDFDDSDLSVSIFGKGLFHTSLFLVLQKWGRPDSFENIGEVMYSMRATNELVILGYDVDGMTKSISIIDGNFTSAVR